ncbi:MAG: 5-formyltetrahydrofolate cyclo-ligase [Roseibacillus sp.]
MAIPIDRQEKERIRGEMRASLKNLSREEIPPLNRALADHLVSWLGPGVRTVAVFANLPGEPDLGDLHRKLPETSFCYPKVVGARLRFHRTSDPLSLRVASFGIREPDPADHPEIAIPEIDVVLCPGLAFAPDGVRLGRGKGFYDRALEEARPNVRRVGVCFALQVRDNLPAAKHDQLMSQLATENGVTDCPPAP